MLRLTDPMRADPVDSEGAYVTEHELIEYIRGQGYDVTGRQIERWHKGDCLPRPHLKYPQGIVGSSSWYPVQSVPQLLALCRLKYSKDYSFDELRILLWVGGYQIPLERVRASIQRVIEHMRDELRRRGLPNWRDTLAVAERLAAQLLPHLSRTKLGRHLRRTLTRQEVASYFTMQMQLLIGGKPAFEADYALNSTDRPLAELVIDVYGLQRAQTDALGDAKPWLPLNIAPTLIKLARQHVFSLKYALTALQQATPRKLEQALADRQIMFVQLPEVIRGAESLFGDNVFGFGMFRALAEWIPWDDADYQALMVVCFLVVRRSGYGHALDQISAAIRDAAAAYSRWQAIIAALECELPAIATAIATNPVVQGGRMNLLEYMQVRHRQAHEIAERHRIELDAFFERHPEHCSADGEHGA